MRQEHESLAAPLYRVGGMPEHVSVFWADVGEHLPALPWYLSLLSPAERARANTYHKAQDRNGFVMRRGIVRHLLAARLGCTASAVPITNSNLRRPIIPDADLQFSVSQSHDIALFAIARSGAIGCDVEFLDPRLATQDVAERVFAVDQLRVLSELPSDRWMEGFYRIWTELEARLKALGTGFLTESPNDERSRNFVAHHFAPRPLYCACVMGMTRGKTLEIGPTRDPLHIV